MNLTNQPRLEMGAKLSEEREQRLEQLRVERLKLEELKEQLQGQRKALMAGVLYTTTFSHQ